ncbi:Hypothetical protein SMAX5B_017589 [Scophthalmus maximus]|uniref:Uncharacterized protein n=1 Tax=Scophthalmus maximus TaxID=52904 RepID=A0A2U9C3S9_SCOMX|nr:Hypothetical protein SMAX5B_017589 [Scophthalmus maximus]
MGCIGWIGALTCRLFAVGKVTKDSGEGREDQKTRREGKSEHHGKVKETAEGPVGNQ